MQLLSLNGRNVLEMNDIPEETDMTQTNSGHHDADDMEMDEDKRDLLVAAFLEQQHLHHDHYGIASDLSINQQMTSPGGQDPDLIPLSSKLLMYHHHEDDGSNGNNSDCLGSSLASNDQSRSLLLLRNSSLLSTSIQESSMMASTFPQDHHHGMDSEVYEAGQQQPSSLTTGRVTEQQQHDSLDCMSGLLGPPPEVVMNAAMSSGPLYLSHQHDLQGTSLFCHPTSSSSSSHEMNLKSVVSGQNHHHHHPSHLQQQPLHSILKTSTSQCIFPPLPPTSSSSLSTNLNIVVPPAVLSGFSGNSYSSPSASSASSSSFVASVHLQQHPYSTVTDFEVW